MLRGFDRPKLKFSRIRRWSGTTTRQESASCPRYVGGVLRGYLQPLSYCYLVAPLLPKVPKPLCGLSIWLKTSLETYDLDDNLVPVSDIGNLIRNPIQRLVRHATHPLADRLAVCTSDLGEEYILRRVVQRTRGSSPSFQ
eukprot:scaffold13577_cov44-Cylindrotheca_fusiformis.AAC.1